MIDTAIGVVGAIEASAALYASIRIVQRSRWAGQREAAEILPEGLAGIVPAQVAAAQVAAAQPFPLADPATIVDAALDEDPGAGPIIKLRKAVTTGRSRTSVSAAPSGTASPSGLSGEDRAELLLLIGTMQWHRALVAVQCHATRGCDPAILAAVAEGPILERIKALPDFEAWASFGGYRVLAALNPANAAYADKAAQCQDAVERRRTTLLSALTRDEDGFDPGTVWYNHPYNPRFDDVRLPIWLYVGCKADGQPWIRLRTNWLGDTRISVQGVDVTHDGITETLTDGVYKIDADAPGWEWRDEQADIYQLEVLRSIVAAREVTLRYKGDPYSVEVGLTRDELRAMAELIELYDLMRVTAALVVRQALAA